MFWFKKKQIKEEINRSIEDVLNDPWEIHKRIINKKESYAINVFRFDDSEWEDISECSKSILGISKKEFVKYMHEVFDVYLYYDFSDDANVRFKNIEDAEKLVELFRPYYDSYHIPRAVADRLTCYDEKNGGYPIPMHLKNNIRTGGAPLDLRSVE